MVSSGKPALYIIEPQVRGRFETELAASLGAEHAVGVGVFAGVEHTVAVGKDKAEILIFGT